MLDKFFKGVNKKQAISWAFYDFANSIPTIMIMTFIFPIYFKEVIAGGNSGDFWWGFVVTVSTVLGGLATPILGAISDHSKRKKLKFIILVTISVITTAALYFTGPNTLVLASIIFIILNLCYEIAQTVYDSFLINISTKETIGRISGLGWGLGYLGGVVALIALKPLYGGGFEGSLASTYKLTFLATALFFLLFSLPSFIFIKERITKPKKEKLFILIKQAFLKNLKTLKEARKNKQIFWFLLGFFILNDALVTIFSFLPIYARTTLSLSIKEITILLLVVQLIAFPATLFLGWLSDKKGPKKILLFTTIMWTVVIFGISITSSKTLFWGLGVLGGLVVGSSQAVARSWFSNIIPKNKLNEFFGFNGFSSKISAIFGPIIFGTISVLTGNQRIAMASLLIYFIASFLIFYKIREPIAKN